jgi:hypothetical protein
MRRESRAEREAWTAHVEGRKPVANKYGNDRTRAYASNLEAKHAVKLWALQAGGIITELEEQVPIVLVEGRGKIRPIIYRADFTYRDSDGVRHVVDVKGCKTPIYRLKRKLAALLLNLEIEEV